MKPEYIYDAKNNCAYYKYNDEYYYSLNDLLNQLNINTLEYHFTINHEIIKGSSLNEIIENILDNIEDFSIPEIYFGEYTTKELSYLNGLKDAIINKTLLKPNVNKIYSKETIAYKKYRKSSLPIKVYNKYFNKEYYTIGGYEFDRIDDALNEIYQNSFYYEYLTTNLDNKNVSTHRHSFEDVIIALFDNPSSFQINKEQEKYYSKQELELINNIKKRILK